MKSMRVLLSVVMFCANTYCFCQDPGLNTDGTAILQMQQTDENGISKKLSEAIEQSNILYGQAYIKGDSLLFIDRYDINACIMAPNATPFTGPMAASDFYTIAYHKMGIRNVILKTKEIYAQGSFATELGSFELRGADDKVLNKGKYIVLWKETNGQWKMFRDCFNSDLE